MPEQVGEFSSGISLFSVNSCWIICRGGGQKVLTNNVITKGTLSWSIFLPSLPVVGYPWPAARPCSAPLWVAALPGWSWAGQLFSAWTTAPTRVSITGPSASRSRTTRALGRWDGTITSPILQKDKVATHWICKVLLNTQRAVLEKVQTGSAVIWNWHWKALNAVWQRQFWPNGHLASIEFKWYCPSGIFSLGWGKKAGKVLPAQELLGNIFPITEIL